ncbi:MAG: response regulator [Clostridia bacterium]|nr:response regulator [Clostridia bacterium]
MRSVYFIDDEYWLLTELKSIIDWKSHGFEVCGLSTDPFIAEKEILELKPDLVICDIYMDGMNGFELAEKVRCKNSKIGFCFLSAYNKFEYAITALKLGAVDYLTKPIKVEELINVLSKVTKEESSLSQDNFWIKAIQDFEVDEELLQKSLKEYFESNDVLSKSECVFAVINGSLKQSKSFTDCIFIYEKDNVKILICPYKAVDKIKGTVSEQTLTASLCQVEGDNYAIALKIALVNANQSFIDQTCDFVNYRKNKGTSEYLNKLAKCENKYEIRVLVSTLKELVIKHRLTLYDLTCLVDEIILHSLKFGIIFTNEISGKKPLIKQFLNADVLYEKLNEVLDKACNKTANSIINSIMKDIQLNFAQVQSLDVYSKKYGYNPSYLSWLFKKETKTSFIEFVIECRMTKAKELLLTTNNSVSEIGYLVGYNDYYHFTKAFKQKLGLSPTDYREKYGKRS